MATAVNEFLLSLASAIAAAASPPLQLAGTPRSMWVHRAIEDLSSDPYTVLRVYGGVEPGHFAGMRSPVVLVQADTRGTDDQKVLAAAWAIHEALLDADGVVRMHWALAGKRFSAADASAADAIEADPAGGWFAWVRRFVTVPGIIGTDKDGRSIATGNVEIEFERQ